MPFDLQHMFDQLVIDVQVHVNLLRVSTSLSSRQFQMNVKSRFCGNRYWHIRSQLETSVAASAPAQSDDPHIAIIRVRRED